jgi:hypothetical protein
MAGDADEKSGRRDPAQRARSDGVGSQVNAMRAAGQGDVGAIVHEDPCAVRIRQSKRGSDQRRKVPSAEIFFPNLNQLDSGGHRVFDAAEQVFFCPERAPVRYVISQAQFVTRRAVDGSSTNHSLLSRYSSYWPRGTSTVMSRENSTRAN